MVTVNGSIIWAEQKAVYADTGLTMTNSVVWNAAGKPVLQIGGAPVITNVVQANPLFQNAAGCNFALTAGSRAIDLDPSVPTVAKDILNVLLPQGGLTDAGAYEFVVA
jgi:hypothetical protein